MLQWCRQHRVDYYPLVVMMIEARDLVNDQENRYFMSW